MYKSGDGLSYSDAYLFWLTEFCEVVFPVFKDELEIRFEINSCHRQPPVTPPEK
jgi:hypothetical protein